MDNMYEYRATVLKWVDGDTVDLCVDQGFGDARTDRFRLYGIDTPERGQANYHEATALAMETAPVGSVVTIRSYKPEAMRQDKYGRWLAEIITDAGDTVNNVLVASGYAVPYFGGTKGVTA
jgi:micrococcal nuclease